MTYAQRMALAEVEAALGRRCRHAPVGRGTHAPVRPDYCRKCANILAVRLYKSKQPTPR